MPFFSNLINRLFTVVLTALFAGCATDVGQPPESFRSPTLGLDFDTYKNVQYASRDSGNLESDVYVPAGGGPFPAVLLIHGGSWAGGNRGYMSGLARRLASEGFTAVNISYRFAPEHVFPAQIEDCQEAVRWMRANAKEYKINGQKIAVWGYSAGGELAALVGTLSGADTAPAKVAGVDAKVQAVIAGSGPHNLVKYPDDEAVPRFLGTTIDKNPDIYRQASPLFNVTARDPPMFLYHGTWDKIVALSHTTEMHDALDKAGVPNEMYLVHGLGHIPLFLLGRAADSRAIRFLKYYLR